jgi:hypothetical protein
MAEALLKTGKHVVTALTRASSASELPDGVEVKKIDYDHPSSIVEALRGQDAFIITMGAMAPKDLEPKLIEAAAEANVPWVFPNAWGFDTANEVLSKEVLVGDEKRKNQELVTKLGTSSWIAVSTGFWYEWSLAIRAGYGFDFAKRALTLFDDGETRICTSTWPQVGRAMASLLSLPIHKDGEEDHKPCLDQFKNGCVYISSFTVSQKDMLESVLRVTHTSLDDWTVTKEPSHARYAAGLEQLKKGDRMGFTRALYTRVFYPDDSGNVEKTRGLQNEVLGLPKEDIDEFTKIAIERSKVSPFN